MPTQGYVTIFPTLCIMLDMQYDFLNLILYVLLRYSSSSYHVYPTRSNYDQSLRGFVTADHTHYKKDERHSTPAA